MRAVSFVAGLLMALVAVPSVAQQPDAGITPPKFTGLVVDAANVLPPETRADLTAKLQKLEADTHRQLVVATIPDLQGRDVEDYSGVRGAWACETSTTARSCSSRPTSRPGIVARASRSDMGWSRC